MNNTSMTSKWSLISAITFCAAFSAAPSLATVITPFEVLVNEDGAVSAADLSGLDGEGLGTLTFGFSGAGAHNIDLFVDYEIDEPDNTFFNEYGDKTGTAAAGQSWEIDEPGYVFGDIYDNLLASALDDYNNVPSGWDDDVSMALGWDFVLDVDEIASVAFTMSRTAPVSGLYLTHWDPDSNDGFYFSSTLDISTIGVPAPASVLLLLTGLLGLGLGRRR